MNTDEQDEFIRGFKAGCRSMKKQGYVKPVRCRGCEYYAVERLKSDYTADRRCKPSVCIKGEFAVRRKPDWFCGDGERKVQDADS